MPLRPVQSRDAVRAARAEERRERKGRPRVSAARHLRRRIHPGRPRILGCPARRALCRRGGELGDSLSPGVALLPRRVGRIPVPRVVRQAVRPGLQTRALHRAGLPVRARAQMVHDVAPDHGQRPVRRLCQRAGAGGGVPGHLGPELQAAQGRARLRCEPVGAHVAHHDVADEVSLGFGRLAAPSWPSDMRFGLFTSMGAQTWSGVLDLWRHIEATGWDIGCVTDHFMPNTKEREGAMLESWSTLTALAALVPRIRVGTIVLGNTYRHPAVVAKMAAQVDIISGGRLLLGLGGAWQENEHEAYGIPFYTVRERLERLDEACTVIRSLWTERRSNFQGRYYRLTDAPLDPKPVQKPHPELMIGGGGGRVTLRVVARQADHWNVWAGPKVLARKTAILEEHCSKAGRDSKAIRRSVNMALLITDKKADVDRLAETIAARMGRHAADARDTCLAGTPDQIREQLNHLQAAGATTLFIPTMFRPLDQLRRDLDRFIAEIAPGS